LSHCYFLYNNNIHTLEDSGPIGLALMVVMAESFLQHHEANAIKEASSLTPPINLKSFKRYVNDSHARFDIKNDALRFLNILNKQNKNIQYTIEMQSENKSLDFLDITITNTNNGKYQFKIHRKEAITNVQLKPSSSHDPKVLNGIFKGFVERAYSLCSTNYLEEELNFLTKKSLLQLNRRNKITTTIITSNNNH